MPSLKSLIGAQGTPESAVAPVPPAVPSPFGQQAQQVPNNALPPMQASPTSAPTTVQFAPAQASPTPTPSQSSSFAAALRQRDFSIPDDWSDEQVLDAISQQIDESTRIQDEYRARQASAPSSDPRASRPAPAPAPAPASASQPNTGNALPAQPASGEQPSLVAGTPPKVSEDAHFLAQSQRIYKDANNRWVSSLPEYQRFADEYNQSDAWKQTQALRLINDPNAFVSPIIDERMKSAFDSMQAKISQLEEQLQTRAQREEVTQLESRVSDWIEANSQRLFQNGNPNVLTPFGLQFNKLAQKLESQALASGVGPDINQIRSQTIDLLQVLDVDGATAAPTPANPAVPVPAPQQRQSFMQYAASTPARSPQNRMTEIHPSQQASPQNHVPLGPGRVPSLRSLINQQTSSN